MANLACGEFAHNAARLQLTLIVLNQMTHTAARVTHSARRTTLRLAADWRWIPDLLDAFAWLPALPPAPP
jgi:hypothetical protein